EALDEAPQLLPDRGDRAAALVVAVALRALVLVADAVEDAPLDGAHDLAQGDLRRGPREAVASPGAAVALHQARALQAQQDLVDVVPGDVLRGGEALRGELGAAVAPGQHHHQPRRVLDRARDPHQ